MTPRRSMSTTRRLRIFAGHDGVCCLCRDKIDGTREAWTIEHLVALALGGADDDDNCAPAHERCRRQKDKVDVRAIAKADRQRARHLGARTSRWPKSAFKRRVDGTTVRRDEG